jgi:1-acyl-sn-glycerol-3-phosphate acyltransferase
MMRFILDNPGTSICGVVVSTVGVTALFPEGRKALCKIWFNSMLVGAYVNIAGLSALTLSAFNVWPDSIAQNVAGVCCVLHGFWWNIAFRMCPWIRRRHFNLELLDDVGKSGKPVFILGNHVNFLDCPMYMACLPWFSLVWKSRCFYASALDQKLPLFFLLSQSCKNIPVFFKDGGRHGEFKTHKEMADVTERALMYNIDHKMYVSYFPEGKTNPEPRKLQPYRWGAFSKAIELDAELWSFLHAGHDEVWPREDNLGGLPAVCYGRVDRLAPDGVKALMKELGMKEGDTKALAEYCQAQMQTHLDDMFAEKDRTEGRAPAKKTK